MRLVAARRSYLGPYGGPIQAECRQTAMPCMEAELPDQHATASSLPYCKIPSSCDYLRRRPAGAQFPPVQTVRPERLGLPAGTASATSCHMA